MGLCNILPEPEGSDITVFSVQEYLPWKHQNDGKEDVLFIVYKNADGVKRIRMITDPKMEIFFVKPEYRANFFTPREYFEIDKTYSKTVGARAVVKTIAAEMNSSDDPASKVSRSLYSYAQRTGNRQATKEVFKWPYTLMSDLKVEDYYRIQLGYRYNTNHAHLIDKAYLDIEADIDGLSSSEQRAHMGRINACTLIFTFDERRKDKIKPQAYTLLLRDHKRYPQQENFERRVDEFKAMMKSEMDHQTITKDGKERVIDFEADYHINMYDREADLLKAIWKITNYFRPDTMGIWNIAYDIPEIAARMSLLGLDARSIMCDPNIPEKYRFIEMNIDNRPIDVSLRKTYIRMASTTVFDDKMQSYAGLRKGMKSYGSSSLDNVSKVELGVGKHKFPKGVNVKNAAIRAYWEFVKYNIIDVIRMVMIDIVTNDTMAMVYDMNQSNCPWENLFKQTRYQKQIYYTEYLRKGFVPGNNANVNYMRGESEESLEELEEIREARRHRMRIDAEDLATYGPTEKDEGPDPEIEEARVEMEFDSSIDNGLNGLDCEYDEASQLALETVAKGVLDIYSDSITRKLSIPGGMVGDPDLNSENGTELIPGVKSKHVFLDVIDMDYASEYPWAKYTRSMSRSTQIGRLIIPQKISERQNRLPLGQEKRLEDIKAYLPGAEFVEDYISHDIVSFGNVWFGLPTTEEVNRRLEEELKCIG